MPIVAATVGTAIGIGQQVGSLYNSLFGSSDEPTASQIVGYTYVKGSSGGVTLSKGKTERSFALVESSGHKKYQHIRDWKVYLKELGLEDLGDWNWKYSNYVDTAWTGFTSGAGLTQLDNNKKDEPDFPGNTPQAGVATLYDENGKPVSTKSDNPFASNFQVTTKTETKDYFFVAIIGVLILLGLKYGGD